MTHSSHSIAVATVAMSLVALTSSHAYLSNVTVDKCLAGKLKLIGKAARCLREVL